MSNQMKVFIAALVGGVILFLGIFVILVLSLVINGPKLKGDKKEEMNQRVITFFENEYITTEVDMETVEITNSYKLGNGGPIPFAGTKEGIYVYSLLINGEYKAEVWYDEEDDSFELRKTDFPGERVLP